MILPPRALWRAWFRKSVLLLLLLAAAGGRPAGAQVYRIEDLGTLGGAASRAAALNATGQVVGSAETADGRTRAFLWTEGVGMRDLGTLSGGASEATGINARAEVVGVDTAAEGRERAFLWTESGGMRALGTLGGAGSRAWDISDVGWVAGAAENAAGQLRAFLWVPNRGMLDLRTLGGFYSEATAVNDRGQVAGMAMTAAGAIHAFQWAGGTMRDLGTFGALLPHLQSLAWDLNAAGQVAGMAFTIFGTFHAFRWSQSTGMQDLGTLGGLYSYARAINGRGDVVGWSGTPGALTGSERAFLYTDAGGMIDLNTRIDPGLGWVLHDAADINDAGQIAGTGLHHGQVRAFRLTPITDTTAPTTSASLSPPPRASGWHNNTVIVTLTAADNPDGAGVREITYRVEGAYPFSASTVRGRSVSLLISAEGRTTITFFATDVAGNVEAPQTVTVRIDATPPTLTYAGREDYTVDEQIEITCHVSDDLSGIGARRCPEAVGPAYTFGPGSHTLVGMAFDRAGNSAIAAVQFTVRVSYESLCNLTRRFAASGQVAEALCAHLRAAEAAHGRWDGTGMIQALGAYVAGVAEQSGRGLTAEEAEILTRLANALG